MALSEPINPRAVIGSNEAPDYAKQVTDQMAEDYAEQIRTIEAMIDEAKALPAAISDEETMGIFARLIKRMRDAASRLEAFRLAEKEPYLRRAQGVDGFFFGLIDKVARRDRKSRPGVADILQGALDAYQQRKLAEEQARRRREAEEAARIEREKQAAAAKAAREAEEARLAAERARKPETTQAKGAAAEAKEAVSDAAGVEAKIAADRAEEAHVATLARPAELVRTRIDDALVTMAKENYAIVTDDALLDKAALWPFITLDAKEKALRAWAKSTNHSRQMPGAEVGSRNRSVIR